MSNEVALLSIEKDVDESTGEIKAPKNISIKGNVRNQTIIAEGSVFIQDDVIGGRIISRGGIVVVHGGVYGQSSTIEAQKDIKVLFCKGAQLKSLRGTIWIDKDARDSELYAFLDVIIGKNMFATSKDIPVRKKGKLIGGRVTVGRNFFSRTCGGPEAKGTYIDLHNDWLDDTLAKIKDVEKRFVPLTQEEKKLKANLSLPNTFSDMQEITSPRLEALLKEKQDLNSKLKELKDEIQKRTQLKAHIIEIEEDLLPDTTIKIDGESLAVSQPMNNVLIYKRGRMIVGHRKKPDNGEE